jgi:hypothetical protein
VFFILEFSDKLGGVKDTGGNSDGEGNNKQQSTKSSLPPRPCCRQAAAAKVSPD